MKLNELDQILNLYNTQLLTYNMSMNFQFKNKTQRKWAASTKRIIASATNVVPKGVIYLPGEIQVYTGDYKPTPSFNRKVASLLSARTGNTQYGFGGYMTSYWPPRGWKPPGWRKLK